MLAEACLSWNMMLVLSVCLPLRFGDISLQERINQKNFEILEGYYKSLTNTVSSECKFLIQETELFILHLLVHQLRSLHIESDIFTR